MKQTISRRILSFLLVMVMVLGMVPVASLAADAMPFTVKLDGQELAVLQDGTESCEDDNNKNVPKYVVQVPASHMADDVVVSGIAGNWVDWVEATENQVLSVKTDGCYCIVAGGSNPVSAHIYFAEAQPVPDAPISVTASGQQGNTFLVPQQALEVTPGLAGDYGYAYASGITAADVTALDVLVALHKVLLGDAFTKETAADALVVESNMIKKIFGESTSSCGFTINGVQPQDSGRWTEGSGGYPGYYYAYSISEAVVQSGDRLEFFIYTDSYSLDYYARFTQQGEVKEALSFYTGKDYVLTLQGYPIGWYGASSAEEIAKKTEVLPALQIGTLDAAGGFTPLDGKITGEDGAVTLSFDKAGTYALSAMPTKDSKPIVSPWLTVTVKDAVTYPAYENKVYDDFENDLWLQYDFKELAVGDTADLYPRRVPQAITNDTINDVERPNFHFDIVEGDSITLSTDESNDRAKVTAVKAGDTVVMVTYDAFKHSAGRDFAACSVVNTAYAVFSVKNGETTVGDITTTIPYDSYDTVYFNGESDHADMPFTVAAPGAASVVVTCNGRELTAVDGKYTAPLKNRSNIIGVVATDGQGRSRSYYKVVDARYIEITIANKTNPNAALQVGDTAQISFRGITMPVYKLATIYNPTYLSTAFGNKGTFVHYTNAVTGLVSGYCNQFDLATKNTIEVTLNKAGAYTFTSGCIFSQWWGESLGFDKTISSIGQPNLGAGTHEREFSVLPSFTLSVDSNPDAVRVTGVTLNRTTVSIEVGKTLQLSAAVAPADATNQKVTWTLTRNGNTESYYATISDTGLVSTRNATPEGTTLRATATTEDGSFTASCTITVFGQPTDPKPESKKAAISVDTYVVDGNAIVPKTEVTFSAGDTVWDVTKSLLDDRSISYTARDKNAYGTIYVSQIGDFAEFGHGSGSGWMYAVNGVYPDVGCNAYTLKSGDVIQWRYTKNYGEDLGVVRPGNDTNTGTAEPPTSAGTLAPAATVSSGTASATVSKAEADKALEAVKKNNAAELVIAPAIKGEATKVVVTVPKDILASLSKDTKAALTIRSDVAKISLSTAALAALAAESGSDVSITAEKADTAALSDENKALVGDHPVFNLAVSVGKRVITELQGAVTVSLPYTPKKGEDTGKLTVYYLDKDGKAVEMAGARYDAATKSVVFETTHFSVFAVVYDESKASIRFTDVTENDWFCDAVEFAVGGKLFFGTSDTTFSPKADMSRAMLFTVLHRMSGKAGSESGEMWYTAAMSWAKAEGISDGTNPSGSVTREQLVTMLCRYAAENGYAVTSTADLTVYTDSGKVADWSKAAMEWAVDAGIITGRTKTTLAPDETASRAEVAVMMQRFLTTVVK